MNENAVVGIMSERMCLHLLSSVGTYRGISPRLNGLIVCGRHRRLQHLCHVPPVSSSVVCSLIRVVLGDCCKSCYSS